jgi:hypothetical protein
VRFGASAGPGDGPLQTQAAEAFAGEVAAGLVASIRTIRARLHVGQPRAHRVRAYLAALKKESPLSIEFGLDAGSEAACHELRQREQSCPEIERGDRRGDTQAAAQHALFAGRP